MHATDLASSIHPIIADQASRRTASTVAEVPGDPQATGKLAFKRFSSRKQGWLPPVAWMAALPGGTAGADTEFPVSRICPDTCDSSPALVSVSHGVPGSLVGV